MQLFIVSGLIGSGKTTVSKLLKKKGFRYLSADEIVKNILLNNKSVREKLLYLFGESVTFKKNISLKRLREKLILSKKNKQTIEMIIHPAFFTELHLFLDKIKNYNIVLELPLLETCKNILKSHKVITVDCSFNNRLKRVLKKNKLSEIEFTRINKIQKNRSFYINNSDYIISNNDTIDTLNKRFEELYTEKLLY